MIMRNCSKCSTQKPFEAFYKNKNVKDGYNWHCKECCAKYAAVYNRSDKFKEYNKQYFQKHKEELMELRRDYLREYHEENKVRLKAKKQVHYKSNKDMYIAQGAKRKAALLQRIPSWADQKLIRSYYRLAKAMDFYNPFVKHHVDHVVPLQGKFVSGLHTHHNLQILTADANIRKNNKFLTQ